MGTELGDDWAIEDPNEEWYNPTKGPKGTWMPEGKVILELLERIQKEKVFELKWKCPGRRPPPSSQPVEEMETEADFDEEEIEEEKEEDKSTAFGEFDFDDAPSEVSKITPRRTPGSAKASQPQKRVACMDNVLNKIRKQNEAARANKGIRGRRLPIYSTGSPRSRFGQSPSHAGPSQFKSSPLARPFPIAKSPVSAIPKPKPTPSPVPKPTPMEVDQDSNQKVSSTTQPKEIPFTTSLPVMSNQSPLYRPLSSSESSVITSVATSAPDPSVKTKVLQSTPSIPPAATTTTTTSSPPSRPTVPPLRLSVSSALQSQIQAALSSAGQNTQKEYREPIPKLLLKIPPPSANQPATSMLLPPGYSSRTSPGNKNKTSPGSQNRKSPNQFGSGSQQGSSPVLKHASKTPPLYHNAPQTPPSYSSGQKTPPLHHGGPKSPAFNQSAPKTPPIYQNISQTLTRPSTTSGSKTPPVFQNRSKTPPGGVRTQNPQIYQSGSKTPPIYPPRNSPFSPQNFPQSQSVRPPAQGYVIRPSSPAPRGNSPHPRGNSQHPRGNSPHPLQTFLRQPFPPRTTPSPMGSPRGQQPLPSRVAPQSPSAHTNRQRSPFYQHFPPLPMEQSPSRPPFPMEQSPSRPPFPMEQSPSRPPFPMEQSPSRPPFHRPPQQRQTRPKTPPAYHTVVSRAPPPFPPPAPGGGRSPGPNTPISRVPIQAPFKVEENMGTQIRAAHQNPLMVSNSNPTQISQSTVHRFQKASPPANERQTPANLPRPQLPTRHLPPAMLPSQATAQQLAKVTAAENYVATQQQPTTTVAEPSKTVPVQQTHAQSTVQQPLTQHVNVALSQQNSQEKSTGVASDQQTSMSEAESQPTSQQINNPIPGQQTVVTPQQVKSEVDKQ